eukprot:TRINITY_DN21613_c0_g1_i1.p1 TRINITY_DN21613_c0_g1~~TRINITY_DN21613_c0_g1_i1.p1  ORF type:complete len:579 (+),score=56.74 TRINITY_DN21613_c0_g1_i1:112-1737(+)
MAVPKPEYVGKTEVLPAPPVDSNVLFEQRKAKSSVADDDVLTTAEQWGWYMYDWSNSPYYQVYVLGLMPIYLKWLAEGAAAKSAGIDIYVHKCDVDASLLKLPGLGITAGSFPPLVGWMTTVVQVVVLLTFSVLGDFAELRNQLLRWLTWLGSFILVLHVFCTSDETWWFVALLRILAGATFVLAQTYYNAYLPVLVKADKDVALLADASAVATKSMEVSDAMSQYGQMVGYVGGLILLASSTIALMIFECSEDCSEAEVFIWPAIIIALVGLWWTVFSTYTFRVLKTRPGVDFPAEGCILCFGWMETRSTFCMLGSYKNTLLFFISYFLFSDAQSTFCAIAILILDDEQSNGGSKSQMSRILFNCILAALAAFLGIYVFMKVQQRFNICSKIMLVRQLAFFSLVSVAGATGVIGYFGGGLGFYLVMAPAMLLTGSVQSYSRSLCATLIPTGKESALFAFYEISDKGSNAIGALLTAVVHIVLHTYTPMFWFVALEFLVAALLLTYVDIHEGQRAARGDPVDRGQKTSTTMSPCTNYPGPA